MQKNEPSLISIGQMVLEISYPKVRILARCMPPFCRLSASLSHKYDVTDAIRQDNEK